MSWSADFASELGARLRGRVAADPMTRALYSTDASIYKQMPLAAVIPRDDDDVRATVEYAAAHGLPFLPRGGGTSLEGQTVNEALVLDLSTHLNAILEVNGEERWARVQPGVVQESLRRRVAPLGLDFGPDTATAARATLGGMLGNNSAGAHSIVYGKTIDHVQELRCLLADGTETVFGPLDAKAWQAKQRLDGIEGRIYRTVAAVLERHAEAIITRYPKVMRHVCGYALDYLVRDLQAGRPINLAHLIIGSEGTLATILEARVALVPRPKARALLVSQYDDLVAAMEAARAIVPTGPSAVELVDDLVIRQARNHPSLGRLCGFVQGEPKGVLITEFSGEDERQVGEQVETLRRKLEAEGLGYGFHAATSASEQAAVWEVRKSGLSLLLSVKGDAKPIAFVEDTAVPIERLPEYVARLQEVVAAHDTWAGFYGHASVGCLHFRPLINCKDAGDIAKLRAIAESIRDLVVEFDGSLSGEHGDGRTRTEYLPGFYGEEVYGAWRAIKTAFDPAGRLNPGNICDPLGSGEAAGRAERPEGAPEPTPAPDYLIDTHLRYGADYGVHLQERYLDFSREGGMAAHIEMCNGNGMCRKLDTGTMCPSYQATRREKDCTRGRANALRMVMSGGVPDRDFSSHALYDVLDLCLECKGCRAECPSNVDMAKLKYEFLAQYYDVHGTPRRARFFGNVAATSRLGSRFAPLSNWIANAPPVRWLNQRALGISSRRPVPPFVRRTFEQWFNGRPAAGGVRRPRGEVVLFHDTFMNHNYPEVGRAAVAVLEAAGYDVILAPKVCCGRPMLSNGLASQARENARINVERLAGYAQRGVPIVGCEPSCLLMLREDYLDLMPASANARKVADHAFLVEELLLRAAQQNGGGDHEGPLGLRWRETPRQLLVHGHCHQKASVGVAPTLDLLRWVPGYEPAAVDAGCCGMAGSFGYKAEHYDVSMAIGERVLFPAVRRAADAGVVVSGISCRQQIRHGTGRQGRHPVQWLADALPGVGAAEA